MESRLLRAMQTEMDSEGKKKKSEETNQLDRIGFQISAYLWSKSVAAVQKNFFLFASDAFLFIRKRGAFVKTAR